jgi:hypothetical protein
LIFFGKYRLIWEKIDLVGKNSVFLWKKSDKRGQVGADFFLPRSLSLTYTSGNNPIFIKIQLLEKLISARLSCIISYHHFAPVGWGSKQHRFDPTVWKTCPRKFMELQSRNMLKLHHQWMEFPHFCFCFDENYT